MDANMELALHSVTYSASSRFQAMEMAHNLYSKHGFFKGLKCAVDAFCTRRVASFTVSAEELIQEIDIQMKQRLGPDLPERSIVSVKPTSYHHPIFRIKSMEPGAFPVLESFRGEGMEVFEMPESWGSLFCRWFYALRSKVLSLSRDLGISPCFNGRKKSPDMSNVLFFLITTVPQPA